jgi:hypothetical protein
LGSNQGKCGHASHVINLWRLTRTQDAARTALPDTTPCPESIAAIATSYTAKHETGAYLFIVMPENWNGNLVVFAHGGPTYTPPTATSNQRYIDPRLLRPADIG